MTAPIPRPKRETLGNHEEQTEPEAKAEPEASGQLSPSSSEVPLHRLQHQLLERIAADSRSEPVVPSDTVDRIERVVVFTSRLAGPVLFVAALIGLIALIF